jgi:hypothetical protein
MNAQMNRRRLMQLVLALGASAAMRDKIALAAGSHCPSSMFGGLDLASTQDLGREYLAARPNSEAFGTIAGLLADPANEDETLAELRRKMLADFTAGRIVNLSGWFVSETEGCVFAALSRCDF